MFLSKTCLFCNALCFFLQGCSAQNGKDVSDTVFLLNQHKVQISSISEKEYKKAVQVGRLHIDTTQVKKSEGELVLSISGNTKVILRDSLSNSDNTEQVTYNYIGHFKEVGLYVVKVQ